MDASPRGDAGFSLIELLVAVGVLMIITGVVTGALMQMTQAQTTIWNRTEMHSGIRGATELLEQEVGQAGRITVPATLTLSNAVTAAASCDSTSPLTNATTVAVSSVNGLFASSSPAAYELLTTMDGDQQETVTVAAVDGAAGTITACFQNNHAVGTVLSPLGSFAEGIIPPAPSFTNGSSGTVLKMFGDINGDGNMVYVEYTCDTTAHNLYRNVMAFDAGSKPAVTSSQVLLANIYDNPDLSPCFSYHTSTIDVNGTSYTFVLDVAITLTVQTEEKDPITHDYQKETKALLNVSPRNVFNAWMLAGIGYTDRIQPTPATVTNLLPPLS
jgi:type II secretory pathway pseudopilin PulG